MDAPSHREILGSLPAVSFVFSVSDGEFLHLGDGVVDLLGFPISRWQDQDEGLEFWKGLVHDADLERVVRLSREAIAERGSTAFAWRARCSDGKYRWVESRLNCVENESGLLLFGLLLDVHGFPESHVDFFDLVNQSTEGLALLSSELTFDAVNPSLLEALGFEEGDFLGRGVDQISAFEAESAQEVVELVSQVLDGRTVDPLEVELRDEDGSQLVFEVNPSLVRSRSGEPRVLLSLRDITQRRESEQLQRSLEARVAETQRLESIGRLAGGIAHDFNNLLTVIMSNVDLVLERKDLPGTVRGDIQNVADAARRSAELTAQLMAFGRKQMLSPKTIDTNTIVLKIARIVSRVLEDGIEIELELDRDAWPLYVDPTQLEQVLVNLIVNSQDALPAGGSITVRTENRKPQEARDGEWVCISVEDDGLGIAPENVDHIFEPFFTTKPPGLGTGLGLATVHGVVKQSGGHLEVETREHRGTKMHVFLPRSYEQPGLSEVDGVKHRNGQPCEVIVVEDQPLVRRAASRILAAEGYQVHQAETIAEAVEIFEKNEPGAVVCDLNLRGETGWDVKDFIRSQGSMIPIIFMSGDPASIIDDLEGELFLRKPFSRESIIDAVNDAVQNAAFEEDAQR